MISETQGDRPWGIVSDIDLAAAANSDIDKTRALDIGGVLAWGGGA